MVIHIPHASRYIPTKIRTQFILNDAELELEQLKLTDAYTDELFAYPDAEIIKFPYSRLVVDTERFPDDEEEPMSKVGMGRIYTQTADGRPLRRALSPDEIAKLDSYYIEHHRKLTVAVGKELNEKGHCLIIDCHSFPGSPLPCDMDQTLSRPDFCIGTDDFHTPPALAAVIEAQLKTACFSTAVNRPYSGTLVPLEYYGKDRRVSSIMIEVNRSLYMDETTGEKLGAFEGIKSVLQDLIAQLDLLSM